MGFGALGWTNGLMQALLFRVDLLGSDLQDWAAAGGWRLEAGVT